MCGVSSEPKTEHSIFGSLVGDTHDVETLKQRPQVSQAQTAGQAIVTFNGRDHLLGPHGTAVSRTKYDRLIAEWLASARQPIVTAETGLSILELLRRY